MPALLMEHDKSNSSAPAKNRCSGVILFACSKASRNSSIGFMIPLGQIPSGGILASQQRRFNLGLGISCLDQGLEKEKGPPSAPRSLGKEKAM
jgi:hypothetical protein